MKKILISSILVFLIGIFYASTFNLIRADEMPGVERVYHRKSQGRLLSFYKIEDESRLTEAEKVEKSLYKKYHDEVGSTYFWGSRIKFLNKEVPVTVVLKTIQVISNLSGSKEDIVFERDDSKEHTYSYTISGSLSQSASGSASFKVFKGSLAQDLKIKVDYTSKHVEKGTDKYKFKIEPGNKLTIRMVGKGFLYNGLASSRKFFFIKYMGDFEYIEYSSCYIEYLVERG